MKFVVGLGNPGRKYDKTPHNVGFKVVDRLVPGSPEGFFRRQFKADCGRIGLEGGPVLLVKPQTYMNESGEAIRNVLGYYKGSPDQLLVIHDDLDLPLAELRFRARGSSGGHRGIASTIASLGTQEFHRLKLGIGRDPSMDAADYVLKPLDEESRETLERACDRAVEAVRSWLRESIEISAGKFNGGLVEPEND